MKNEGAGLMVGFFEPGSYPWASRGIPADAEFTRLPEDWDHLGPFYENMMKRLPVLADTGIRLHFCGPESFTPDGLYHLGEAPGLRNCFIAAGFNSVGFLSGPGAGSVLADWIVDGRSPIDLPETDPRRVAPHETNRRFLEQRVTETLDLAYQIHWPYQQRSSVRGLRRSPLHDRVTAAGAVFGELLGWERANWYAPARRQARVRVLVRPARTGSSTRRPSTAPSARPWACSTPPRSASSWCRAGTRPPCCSGSARATWRPSRAASSTPSGSTPTAGIEADVTVTRLDETRFLVLSGPATLARDRDWLERHIGPDEFATVTDISQALAMIPVMGPNARRLLQSLTDADLSAEAFPFGTSREIDLGCGFVRATRITYVGEFGWELLIPADLAVHVYDTIAEAGQEHGLRPAGYHALDSLRMEKAYRSWGHDISAGDTPLEAGLGFAVAWDKPGGFTGRDALLRQKEAGVQRRLVQFALSRSRTPSPTTTSRSTATASWPAG